MKKLPLCIDDLKPVDPIENPGYWVSKDDLKLIEEHERKSKKKTKALGVFCALCEIATEEKSLYIEFPMRRIRGIYQMRNKEVWEALCVLRDLDVIHLKRPGKDPRYVWVAVWGTLP